MARSFLLPFLDEFPPAMCRLLARKHRGRQLMSTREIAVIANLPTSVVDELSRLPSWKTVDVARIQQLSLACGVNLLSLEDRKRHREFWKRSRLIYLQRASRTQHRMINRLMDILSRRATPE